MSNIKKGSKLTVSTANGISRATTTSLGVLEVSGPKMSDVTNAYNSNPAHFVVGATDVSGILQVGINNDGNTFIDASVDNNHKDIILQKYGGNTIFGSGSNSTAKVGIGTTSPQYLLDANGSGRFVTSGTTTGVIVKRSNVALVLGNDGGGGNTGQIQVWSDATNSGITGSSPYYLSIQYYGGILQLGKWNDSQYYTEIRGQQVNFRGLSLWSSLTNASSRPSLVTTNNTTQSDNTIPTYEIRGVIGSSPYHYALTRDAGFLRLRAGGGSDTAYTSYIDLTGQSNVSDMQRNIVFGTSGAERMRINSSGNVGIGTTNPQGQLSLYKTGDNGGELWFGNSDINGNGNKNYGKISFNTYLGGGVPYRTLGHIRCVPYGSNYGGDIIFNTNNDIYGGGDRMVIRGNGNVGIGVTDPSGGKLHVDGNIYSTGKILGEVGGSNLIVGGTTYQSATAPTNGMLVEGNVGIGTTNPGYKLHIVNPTLDNSIQDLLCLETHSSTVLNGPALLFRERWNYGSYWNLARIAGLEQSGYGGQLAFYTNEGSTSGDDTLIERMRIDKNGNVGIGTTNPLSLLHIETNASNVGTTEGDNIGSHNEIEALRISSIGDGGDVNSISSKISLISDTNSPIVPYGKLLFYLNNGANIDNIWGYTPDNMVMSLVGSGNVGIGTTNPGAKLEVKGDALNNGAIYIKSYATTDKTFELRIRDDTTSSYPLHIGSINSFDGININNSNGYVGIGAADPKVKLQVNNGNIAICNYHATYPSIQLVRIGTSDVYGNDPWGDCKIENYGGSCLIELAASGESNSPYAAFRATATHAGGNVIVGRATSVTPKGQLHIRSNVGTKDNPNGASNPAMFIGDENNGLYLNVGTNSGGTTAAFGLNWVNNSGVHADADNALVLRTYDGDNRVGIGTTNPHTKLEVLCSVTDEDTDNTPQQYNTTISNNVSASFTRFSSDNSNIFGLFIGTLANTGNSYLQNLSTNYNNYYDILLQPNGGSVGIGGVHANYKLSIYGTGNTWFPSAGITFNDTYYNKHWYLGTANNANQGDFYIRAMDSATSYPNNNGITIQHSTGNVGIGTTNPYCQLQVGSLGAGGNVYNETKHNRIAFPSHSHGNNRYLFANRDPDNNTACLDLHYVHDIATLNRHLMTFTNQGNIGIGTTNISHSAKLEVYGGDLLVRKDGGSTTAAQIMIRGGGGHLSYMRTRGNGSFELESYASYATLHLNKNNKGNVAVATNTDVTFNKFDVEGSTSTKGLQILSNISENTNTRPAIATRSATVGIKEYEIAAIPNNYTDRASNHSWDNGFLRIRAGGGTNANQTSYIDLTGYSQVADMDKNIVFGTTGTERMRIDKYGNVGIGVTNPSTMLQVQGQIHSYDKITGKSGGEFGVGTPTDYTFSVERKITPSDGATSDTFGNSVSVYNNKMIVGAASNADKGASAGSAYIFDITTGAQLHKLYAGDAAVNDNFGWSVAISVNYAIVGAPYSDQSPGSDSGAAYIFDIRTGAQIYELTGSDLQQGAQFGWSVAIDNKHAAVGARYMDAGSADVGRIYVFELETGTQIMNALMPEEDRAANDQLGYSVAIAGDYAAAGAVYDHHGNGPDSGAVYVFDIKSETVVHALVPNDSASNDYFGSSVAMSGNYIIVGANGNDDVAVDSGSAYIFDVITGTQLHKLTANDPNSYDRFGSSVAISGNYAVVGAEYDDDGGNASGSAYVFDVRTGSQLKKIIASDDAADDLFGVSVSIDGNYIVVGSKLDDDNSLSASGSAYVYGPAVLNPPTLNCNIPQTVEINGNVGIGTTSPTETLHVNGSVGAGYKNTGAHPSTITNGYNWGGSTWNDDGTITWKAGAGGTAGGMAPRGGWDANTTYILTVESKTTAGSYSLGGTAFNPGTSYSTQVKEFTGSLGEIRNNWSFYNEITFKRWDVSIKNKKMLNVNRLGGVGINDDRVFDDDFGHLYIDSADFPTLRRGGKDYTSRSFLTVGGSMILSSVSGNSDDTTSNIYFNAPNAAFQTGLIWRRENPGGVTYINGAILFDSELQNYSTGTTTGFSAGGLSFYTSDTGSGWSSSSAKRRMVIHGDGNVGIGTSNPVQKLNVQGHIAVAAHPSQPTSTSLLTNPDGQQNALIFYNRYFSYSGGSAIYSAPGSRVWNNFISSKGHAATPYSGSAAYHAYLLWTYTPDGETQPDTAMQLGSGNGNATLWVNGSTSISSDRRIKTNITDVPDHLALEMVRKIPCRYYEYKRDIYNEYDYQREKPNRTIGFIAQEVKDICPEAVTTREYKIPHDNKLYRDLDIQIDNSKNFIIIEDYTNNDLSANDELECIINPKNNNNITQDNVKELINSNDDKVINIKYISDSKFEILDDIDNVEIQEILLKNKKVDDFHILDKQKLFALNFSATQEIDRIQQQQVIDISNANATIQTLQTDLSNANTTIQQQATTIQTLETQIADILTRLSNLENTV